MAAIITDQIRVLNASNFVSGISTTDNSYYVFIGLPNATSAVTDWNTNTPSPIDNFDQHDKVLAYQLLMLHEIYMHCMEPVFFAYQQKSIHICLLPH